jgi:hypothetical protein
MNTDTPNLGTASASHGTSALRAEVRQLRTTITAILGALHRGQIPDLTAEPYASFLGHPPGGDYEAVIDKVLRNSGQIIGTVQCPDCGAAVDDLAGVTDERCFFCGTVLSTPR